MHTLDAVFEVYVNCLLCSEKGYHLFFCFANRKLNQFNCILNTVVVVVVVVIVVVVVVAAAAAEEDSINQSIKIYL